MQPAIQRMETQYCKFVTLNFCFLGRKGGYKQAENQVEADESHQFPL